MPLAAGLALLPGPVAALVAMWFVLAARRRAPGASPSRTNAAHVAVAIFTGIALLSLAGAASSQLRGAELDVAADAFRLEGGATPAQSPKHLAWYVDHTDGTLPRAWIIAISPWWLRALFGAWCIFAGWLVMTALRHAWSAAVQVGLWRSTAPVAGPPIGPFPHGAGPGVTHPAPAPAPFPGPATTQGTGIPAPIRPPTREPGES